MCFTEILRYRCGHSDIEQRECRASEDQEYHGQLEETTFWQRLFGRRGKISESQCMNLSINRYVDDYCGPCLRAAERQRRRIMAKAKDYKQSSQARMAGQRQEGRGQSALSIRKAACSTGQVTPSVEQEKDKLLFRCSKCKLEKRYPRMEQRSAYSGLCCANGIAEFEQLQGHPEDSNPGSGYVQATSSTVRADARNTAKDSRNNMPSSKSFSGAGEYRRKDLTTEASSSKSTGNPPASQIDNPTGIDFVRWQTTIRRTDHGSYPGPSTSPPDKPLPTRPLLIIKTAPASGLASESGRTTSVPSSGELDVAPPIPCRHPSRAIRNLLVPAPPPLPQRGSSFKGIFESPGGTRIKPILKIRGVDGHYYPPPSPPPSPTATSSSHAQSPATPHTLRRSSQRIEDLRLSSGFSDTSLGSPVVGLLPKRRVTFQLDLQASPVERGEVQRSNGEVPSRLEAQCDEIEELWLRRTDRV